MEEKIRSIKFDLGSLPTNNPNAHEVIQVSDDLFPGQFIYTKRAHNRSLEVLIGKAVSRGVSERIFTLKYSFPYYTPEFKGGQIEDNPINITRKLPYGFGVFGLAYSKVTAPSVEFFNGQKIIYGKLPRYNEKTNKIEKLILDHPKQSYEFYSMDKNMNVHEIKIDLKYLPTKDLMKFTVIYDCKIKVTLDTAGKYLLKTLKAHNKEKIKKKGNLLNEENCTLYLDKEIPIKIHAESF